MVSTTSEPETSKPLTWDIEISVLTNSRLWSDLIKAALVITVLLAILIGIPLGIEREWYALGRIIPAAFAGTLLLFIVGTVGLTLITGNRFRLHYKVSESGVICTVTDSRARAISRGTFLTGVLAGNLAATGVGLNTMLSEERTAFWSRIERAVLNSRRHTIDLRGSWRSLLVVHCPPEIYPQASAFIQGQLEKYRRSGKHKEGPKLGALVLWSLANLLACLPLFVLPFPFEIDLFIPILLLCFSVATVWFFSPLAYATLLGIAGAIVQIILLGLERHTGAIGTMTFDYSGFETLHGDELPSLIIAMLGLLFLGWFAIRTLRGKGPSALERDMTE